MSIIVYVRLVFAAVFVFSYFVKDSSCLFGGFLWFQSVATALLLMPFVVAPFLMGKYFCFVTYASKKNIFWQSLVSIFEVAMPFITVISFSRAISFINHENAFSCYTKSSWILIAAAALLLFDPDGKVRKLLWSYRLNGIREIPDSGIVAADFYISMFFTIILIYTLPFVIMMLYHFV